MMNSSEPVGTVRALWRFPVKSMLGEQLDAADVGEGGIVGDRAYAVRDRQTGKVASAKHPKLWPGLLACRAAFVEPPRPGDELPPVRIDLADGKSVLQRRAGCRRRPVALFRARRRAGPRRAERLHDRSIPPRRGELRSGGHRDEVVEVRLGAAFFNERGLPPPSPTGRSSTSSRSASSRRRPSSSSASSSRRAALTPAGSA